MAQKRTATMPESAQNFRIFHRNFYLHKISSQWITICNLLITNANAIYYFFYNTPKHAYETQKINAMM